MNRTQKFAEQLVKLEPIEFLGIAKLFSIDINQEFHIIFNEILDNYNSCSKSYRKKIKQIINAAEGREK